MEEIDNIKEVENDEPKPIIEKVRRERTPKQIEVFERARKTRIERAKIKNQQIADIKKSKPKVPEPEPEVEVEVEPIKIKVKESKKKVIKPPESDSDEDDHVLEKKVKPKKEKPIPIEIIKKQKPIQLKTIVEEAIPETKVLPINKPSFVLRFV